MTARRRRGFTLIEILVVIGILMLLIGIGVIGFQKLDQMSNTRATITRLETCKSIMSEYELSATLQYIESTSTSPVPIYQDASASSLASISNPGDVSMGNPGTRYNNSSGPIFLTGAIFQQFERVPVAKTMIEQLPQQTIMQGQSGAFVDSGNNSLPIIVDGWKNPIIFVPAGGMSGVWVGGAPNPGGYTTGGPWGHQVTVKAKNGRPFFASAGQDGDFSTGDDNKYSTEVVNQ